MDPDAVLVVDEKGAERMITSAQLSLSLVDFRKFLATSGLPKRAVAAVQLARRRLQKRKHERRRKEEPAQQPNPNAESSSSDSVSPPPLVDSEANVLAGGVADFISWLYTRPTSEHEYWKLKRRAAINRESARAKRWIGKK